MAERVQPKKFFTEALNKEIRYDVGSFERARNLAQEFPALSELGMSFSDYTHTTRVQGRLEKSILKGKNIGWEVRGKDGAVARYRIDWDPEKGAHINLEIMKATPPGSRSKGNFKAAIEFKCGGHPCSQQEVLQLAEKNFGP